MRYFRYFPWGLQLLLFLILVFTMYSFAGWGIAFFLPKITGLDINFIESIDAQSPLRLINAGIAMQAVFSICGFVVPALLFAYFTHPKPSAYLGLNPPGNYKQVVLVILCMLGAVPVLDMLEALMSQLPLGKAMRDSQAANDKMMAAFLTMPDLKALINTFLALAIIPAAGEELFFRGVLMKIVRKRSKGMLYPILFTAVVFAAFHLNIYGLPSIFLAGVLLASIYNLTGSLWCSILAHALFNGTQILLSYGADHDSHVKWFVEKSQNSWWLVLGGGILFFTSFSLLIKYKTPLPTDWADDFRGEPDETEKPV